MDAEAGTKIIEQRFWKAFSKDVCILVSCRHVQNMNLTKCNFFSNEVNIHLDMFGTLMIHGVSREVYGTYVVTIDHNCF